MRCLSVLSIQDAPQRVGETRFTVGLTTCGEGMHVLGPPPLLRNPHPPPRSPWAH